MSFFFVCSNLGENFHKQFFLWILVLFLFFPLCHFLSVTSSLQHHQSVEKKLLEVCSHNQIFFLGSTTPHPSKLNETKNFYFWTARQKIFLFLGKRIPYCMLAVLSSLTPV